MALDSEQGRRYTYPLLQPGNFEKSTLTGNATLTGLSGRFQGMDPGGSNRDVALPAVTTEDAGDRFFICNLADAAENLVVKSGTTTVGTVNQNESGLFYVDDAGAWALFCMFTTAGS